MKKRIKIIITVADLEKNKGVVVGLGWNEVAESTGDQITDMCVQDSMLEP